MPRASERAPFLPRARAARDCVRGRVFSAFAQRGAAGWRVRYGRRSERQSTWARGLRGRSVLRREKESARFVCAGCLLFEWGTQDRVRMFASSDLKHISDGQVVRGAMTQERVDRVHGRAGNGFGGGSGRRRPVECLIRWCSSDGGGGNDRQGFDQRFGAGARERVRTRSSGRENWERRENAGDAFHGACAAALLRAGLRPSWTSTVDVLWRATEIGRRRASARWAAAQQRLGRSGRACVRAGGWGRIRRDGCLSGGGPSGSGLGSHPH